MARPNKTCAVCESGIRIVDFKDERLLTRFLTERGKILPSRLSGTCARHQRQRRIEREGSRMLPPASKPSAGASNRCGWRSIRGAWPVTA